MGVAFVSHKGICKTRMLVSVKLYVDKPPSHAPGTSGVPVASSLPPLSPQLVARTWTLLAHFDFIFCVFVLSQIPSSLSPFMNVSELHNVQLAILTLKIIL